MESIAQYTADQLESWRSYLDWRIEITNDGKTAKDACEAVRSVVEDDVWDRVKNPLPGSDDFAGIAERIPSVYFLHRTKNIDRNRIISNK